MTTRVDSTLEIGASDATITRVGNDLRFKDANAASPVNLSELTLARRTETVNLTIGHDATSSKSPAATLVARTGTTNSSTVMTAFAFNDTTEQFIVYDIYAPVDLNATGTVNIRFQWIPATSASNNVVWKIYHAAVAPSGTFDVALASLSVTSAGFPTADAISQATISASVASLGWAAGNHIILHVSRDAANGSDNLTGDAQLIAFAVEFPIRNSGAQGGGGLFAVKNEGVALTGSPFSALNLIGSAITAVGNGSDADVTLSTFDGNLASTQGYLNNTTVSTPVIIRDSDGLSIKNGNASPVEGMKIRVLSTVTTDATVTETKVDGTSLTLADNTAHMYVVYLSARCTGGSGGNTGKIAMFKFEVAAKASSGTATIVGGEVKLQIANERDGIWDANVVVTSNKIQFTVTGAVNDNITWSGWVGETTIF